MGILALLGKTTPRGTRGPRQPRGEIRPEARWSRCFRRHDKRGDAIAGRDPWIDPGCHESIDIGGLQEGERSLVHASAKLDER